jgi:hypothetical protein
MNTLMWTEVAFSALLLCFAILSEMVSHQAILKRQMVYADPNNRALAAAERKQNRQVDK